jgi:DNA-binding NarL/FixJ family response regulator
VRSRAVLVAHREALAAEGIASALDRLPGIVSLGSVSSAEEALTLGERADAVALDRTLPRAEKAASRLRAKGVRVVFLGDHHSEDDGGCAKTVEQHKTNIYSKLGVANGTAAVSLLLRDGNGRGNGNGDRWTRSST